MSVQKLKNGRYLVRWEDPGGPTAHPSKTFDRRGDAETFDRELKRAKQLGPHLFRELTRGSTTLAEFVKSGFRAHAADHLGEASRAHYLWSLEHHLTELLGLPLVAIDVPTLADHQRHLLVNGRTPNTVREVLADLSGILTVAANHGLITGNPVHILKKVPLPERKAPVVLEPAELEAMIDVAHGSDKAVLVLGWHLGLRPQGIRKSLWSAVGEERFVVARDAAKLRRQRVVELYPSSAHQLKELRLRAGRPEAHRPIIGEATAGELASWHRRVLRPLAKRLGIRQDITLYTLRHSHASALHYAGATTAEAAGRLGHSAVVHYETYAHVIEALQGQRFEGFEALISAARDRGLHSGCIISARS